MWNLYYIVIILCFSYNSTKYFLKKLSIVFNWYWVLYLYITVFSPEKGDGNPETNRGLAQIIESAKRQSMPLTSIQNAIKVAQVGNFFKIFSFSFKIFML